MPAARAGAALIGPGTAITNDENDNAGGRINVDQGSTVTLPAGNYIVTTFDFDAGIAGDVTPFLARSAGTDVYTAIAVGTTQNVQAGQDQSLAFGGSATFTLNATTQLFAGIASSTQNPIALDNGTAANTDHEGGGQAATSYVVALNGTVPPDQAFSNPNLGRTYAFGINVVPVPVPEPGTAGVAGTVALGLIARRRRRAS